MSEKQKTAATLAAFAAALLIALVAILGMAPSRSAAPALAPDPTPTPKPSSTVYVMPKPTSPPQDYVLNNHTKRFHYPDCKSVPDIAEKNREDVFASRDELLARGFKSCGNCKP